MVKEKLEVVKKVQGTILSSDRFGDELIVKRFGSGAHIVLPKEYVGKKVMVVVLD